MFTVRASALGPPRQTLAQFQPFQHGQEHDVVGPVDYPADWPAPPTPAWAHPKVTAVDPFNPMADTKDKPVVNRFKNQSRKNVGGIKARPTSAAPPPTPVPPPSPRPRQKHSCPQSPGRLGRALGWVMPGGRGGSGASRHCASRWPDTGYAGGCRDRGRSKCEAAPRRPVDGHARRAAGWQGKVPRRRPRRAGPVAPPPVPPCAIPATLPGCRGWRAPAIDRCQRQPLAGREPATIPGDHAGGPVDGTSFIHPPPPTPDADPRPPPITTTARNTTATRTRPGHPSRGLARSKLTPITFHLQPKAGRATGNLANVRRDAGCRALHRVGVGDFVWPDVGPDTSDTFLSVCLTNFLRAGWSFNRSGPAIPVQWATRFTFCDMADSWRFVMTFCYDFALLKP